MVVEGEGRTCQVAPQARCCKLTQTYTMDGLDPRWRLGIVQPTMGELFCCSVIPKNYFNDTMVLKH